MLGLTPLMGAALGGHARAMRTLLRARAYMDVEDARGLTAHDLAARSDSFACAKLLHEAKLLISEMGAEGVKECGQDLG